MTRLLLLLAALALVAQAQPVPRSASPTQAYHTGAQAFIAGETAAALAAVDAGLAVAPDDPKLQALRDLIAPPDPDQDDQQGQDEQDPEDSEPDEPGDEGEPDPQQPPDAPEDGGQEAEQDQTQTQDPGQAEAGEAPAQPEGREAQPMTPAQAERILDAVGGEEKLLLRELRRAPTQRSRSEKDW